MVPLLAVLLVFVVLALALGLALWALVSIGIVGLIIGGVARLLLPGVRNVGLFATVILGWIGSVIGGFIGDRVVHTGWLLTILLEIGVAALLLVLYSGRSSRNSGGAIRIIRIR